MSEKEKRAKRRFASRQETVKMAMLMEKYLHPSPEGDGTFTYDTGWDDGKIAREVAPDLGHGHAAGVRMEMHGPIRAAQAPKASAKELEAKIDGLQSKVIKMNDDYYALLKIVENTRVLHARLCLALAMNQVLDVKYLMGDVVLDHPEPRINKK